MVERDRTAGSGLSADRAVAVVRVHLDRVHDAVLRTGCTPDDAVEVVRATALALVERSAAEPGSADEAVGRWFADAQASGRQLAGEDLTLPPGDGPQQGLQAALDGLPDEQRLAVLLRDADDLPPPAVAAALGTGVATAGQVLDQARRSLPARDALTGLTVLGLPALARSDVLRQVEDLAHRRLPLARPRSDSRRAAAAPAVGPAPEPPARLLSPLLAALSVVLAVLAGVGVGLFLGREDGPQPLSVAAALPSGVALVTPQPSITDVPSPPTVAEQRPRTDVVVVPPSPLPTPTPTPSPTPSPTPTPTAPPALVLSPAGGTNATTIAVTGTGFAPGDQVRLDYLDPAGVPTGSSAVAVADDSGTVTASLAAQDPTGTPGPHTVLATVGDATTPVTSAIFTAE